ncbi:MULTISPECIES: benzoate/H(+) symporter BenE family transporter [unclassified Acinetobacter]|uniref:benzoate/H(+) symporter BenE family transporter n=1 Tax=unclassified Acinetobacter TaxID=196816 RepID=UPI0035B88D33
MQTPVKFSGSHFSAALATILVAYGSSAVILYKAAVAFGATPVQINSWFTIMAICCGVLTLVASLRYKMPIMYAWCTPGAALMVGVTGVSLPQAISAFMFASLLMLLVSSLGLFSRLVKMVPSTLASAMLAGVLLNFGIGVFHAMQQQLLLVLSMLFAYFISKLFVPKFSILFMLCVSVLMAVWLDLFSLQQLHWVNPSIVWVTPEWHFASMISVGIPLFIATLATQNVPGMAVLKSYGYQPPTTTLVNGSALTTIFGAPLGVFTINLAAISAAICMEKSVDPDANKRYLATVILAGFYFLMACFGGMVVALFTALPMELLLAFAGIAIFSTLQSNIVATWHDEITREASLMTLLITASGMTLWGVGSAFWGLLFGLLVYHFNHYTSKKA